jgi:hypothetical protein
MGGFDLGYVIEKLQFYKWKCSCRMRKSALKQNLKTSSVGGSCKLMAQSLFLVCDFYNI